MNKELFKLAFREFIQNVRNSYNGDAIVNDLPTVYDKHSDKENIKSVASLNSEEIDELLTLKRYMLEEYNKLSDSIQDVKLGALTFVRKMNLWFDESIILILRIVSLVGLIYLLIFLIKLTFKTLLA